MRTGFLFNVSMELILARMLVTILHVGKISAQNTFTVASNNYSCSVNLICIGDAHVYAGNQSSGIQDGRLSLLNETSAPNTSELHAGIAYYKEPVRLLDYSAQQSASFNTSFTIDKRKGLYMGNASAGDGVTFVISANNATLGAGGSNLGFFNEDGSALSFKAIVVEFDTYLNNYWPAYDISDNHVSFDFSNLTSTATANASLANVNLQDEYSIYAWVEYSNETQKLEVRISYWPSRPTSPLLSYKMNLLDYIDEYMWVGFSSGSARAYCNYYIGDWTFESWFGSTSGSPASGQVPGRDITSHKSNRGTILGIAVGVPLSVLVCVCIVIPLAVKRSSGKGVFRHFRLKIGFVEENDKVSIEGMPERFSYKQLSEATGQFNDESKLGQGGFGSVYRGVLPSTGRQVAVKKLGSNSAQGEKEFMAEVSIISQLRHRNLIQLLGWCKEMASSEKYLLVYELMPNGSLDKWLFPRRGPAKKFCLSWQQRFNIIRGTAAALDYLHQGCQQQVIHRDVKASNIMLDEEWNAKLGDFGLARLADHQRSAATTGVAGTYGYLAPEAAATGHFTDRTDVFALGVVMLEIACGRKASSEHVVVGATTEDLYLVDWVWRNKSDGHLHRVVDIQLKEYDTYWMEVVMTLGLLCSHPNPSSRPTMKQVVLILAGDAPVPSIPASKPDHFTLELPKSLSKKTSKNDGYDGEPENRLSTSRSASISLVRTNASDSSRANTGKFRSSSLDLTPSFSEDIADVGKPRDSSLKSASYHFKRGPPPSAN